MSQLAHTSGAVYSV